MLVGRSPEKLNDLGEAVSEHLGAKDWARQEASKLQKLQGLDPFGLYEESQQHVKDDSQLWA